MPVKVGTSTYTVYCKVCKLRVHIFLRIVSQPGLSVGQRFLGASSFFFFLSLYLVLFLYFSIHFLPPSLSKSLASSPTLSFPVNCFTPSVFNPTSFSQSLSFNFYIYILVFLPLYQSFLCHFFIISFFQPLSIYLIIYFIKTTVDGPVLAFTWLFFIGRLGGGKGRGAGRIFFLLQKF